MASPALDAAFDTLTDCVDDFENAGYQNASGALKRLTVTLAEEPLRSLQLALLPAVDFQSWWDDCLARRSSMAGSASFNWPTDTPTRVATQIALCRALTEGTVSLQSVAIDFCYTASNRFDDMLRELSTRLLRPLVRDLQKLADSRVAPPILAEFTAVPLPPSGDSDLDRLFIQARDEFRDKSPAVHRRSLERLWDAWERLKSLQLPGDKRASASILLDRAASEPAFRAIIEADARALTDIGNAFQIRHFETTKVPIEQDAHVDYLFHRLWALAWLLLRAR